MQIGVDGAKLLLSSLLISKSFDDLLIIDGLVDMCAEPALNFGLHGEILVRALDDKRSDKNGERRYQNDDDRNDYIDREHEAQRAKNRDDAGEKLGQALGQAIADLRNVVDHPADDVTVCVGIDIAQGNSVQFGDGGPAEIPRRILYDDAGENRSEPLEGCADKQGNPIKNEDARHCGKIDLALPNDEIDGIADQNRPEQGKRDADERRENRQKDIEAVWLEHAEKPAKCCLVHRYFTSSSKIDWDLQIS